MKDLRFKDGLLDCESMYNIIQNKRNLLIEIQIVYDALRPYKQYILNNDNRIPTTSTIMAFAKSKSIYELLIKQKTQDITPNTLPFSANINPNSNISCILRRKMITIKEIKLREFNFKIIHNILPCNQNLKRWRITQEDKCDICEEVQSIKHLLFECGAIKRLWELVEEIINCKITYYEVICGFDKNLFANYITNITAFVIYKDWLLHSLQNEKRNPQINLAYFEHEISLRLEIYDKAKLRYQQ